MEYTRNNSHNHGHNKSPLFQKLAAVQQVMRQGNRTGGFMEPERSPMLWIADGVDHININITASTELGQVLTHSSPVPFVHSIFGRFVNMEAFWHYIQSEERDDRICNMVGHTLTMFSKKLTHKLVTNFRAIIVDSNWQRIKQHPVIAEEMKNSTLPFDCWYIARDTGMRKRPIYFKWLISGFEEIRKALKEGREPDFDYLKEIPGTGIYEFAMPKGFASIVKKDPPAPRNNENKGPSLLNRTQAAAKKKLHEERQAARLVTNTGIDTGASTGDETAVALVDVMQTESGVSTTVVEVTTGYIAEANAAQTEVVSTEPSIVPAAEYFREAVAEVQA